MYFAELANPKQTALLSQWTCHGATRVNPKQRFTVKGDSVAASSFLGPCPSFFLETFSSSLLPMCHTNLILPLHLFRVH